MKDAVLMLFDKTGNMARPWVDAGYKAIIIDIQHPLGETTEGSITRMADAEGSYVTIVIEERSKLLDEGDSLEAEKDQKSLLEAV